MKACSILAVGSDGTLGTALSHCVDEDAYSVTSVVSLQAARAALFSHDAGFAVVFTDVCLADGTGYELCMDLRGRNVAVPIILSGDGLEEVDLVTGLAAGANDVITRPFRPAELSARLRAAMRSYRASKDIALLVGQYIFKPGTKTLHEPGKRRPVRLTEKEARMLRFLYEAEGKPITPSQLMRECWGYVDSMHTHTVQSHVYRLRQKMERDPTTPRILLTGPGGYRLDAAGSDDASAARA